MQPLYFLILNLNLDNISYGFSMNLVDYPNQSGLLKFEKKMSNIYILMEHRKNTIVTFLGEPITLRFA